MNDYVILIILAVLLLGVGAVALVKLFYRTQFDLALVVLGLLGWGAAILFALLPLLNTVHVDVPRPTISGPPGGKVEVHAANPASAGAACGFAIGGGLCFLGAALAARRDGHG